MNSTFCDNCDNFMFTYVDTKTNKLYNGCKVCGNKDNSESDANDYIYKSNVNIPPFPLPVVEPSVSTS